MDESAGREQDLKLAYLFPGQGAQYVGMGRELMERYPVVQQTFDAADQALGFSLSQVFLEGPEEKLRLTYYTQPALLTASVAAWRLFDSLSTGNHEVVAVAGHSLGEYSALVAAGALSFATAVQLVYQRGRLMDDAVPAGQGAMSAVLGVDEAVLSEVCVQATEGDEVVELANLNCPGQIVISGTAAAIARAGELAKTRGARRVLPLVVSGPFHCSLMKRAAAQLYEVLSATELRSAAVPVVANVDAQMRTDPDAIRDALSRQLYSPVRWEDDTRCMLAAGVEAFVEFGPGTVLSGLVKKVERGITTCHVEDDASLQETLRVIT